MNVRNLSRRRLLAGMGVAGAAGALAACGATPTPQVIEKVVKETVEVEKIVEQTVEVEKVTTQIVEKEVVVTATPSPKGVSASRTSASLPMPRGIPRASMISAFTNAFSASKS